MRLCELGSKVEEDFGSLRFWDLQHGCCFGRVVVSHPKLLAFSCEVLATAPERTKRC